MAIAKREHILQTEARVLHSVLKTDPFIHRRCLGFSLSIYFPGKKKKRARRLFRETRLLSKQNHQEILNGV